jgi:hypothetical protein
MSGLSSLSQFQGKIGKKSESKMAITDKGLLDYYESCKSKTKKLSNNINDFVENVDKKVQSDMSRLLSYQQGVLELKSKHNKEETKIRNNISRRLGKSMEQILMNNVHLYREKNELENILEANKPIESLHGQASWLTSLRRPDNFKGSRIIYINTKDSIDTLWQILKEEVPKESEIIRSPKKTSDILDKALSNNYVEKMLTEMNVDYSGYGHRRNFSNLSVNII